MAEQRNQTPAGDNTQWTTIIRPRTGWFDVDLEELWRYRDLIVMFVKRNFTVLYKQTILGPAWIILNPLITTVIFNVVFGGMANIGTAPTVSTDSRRTIEVNLFDFSGDLYGRRIEVEFIDRMRDERRFPNLEALTAQLRADLLQARRLLGG